MRGSRPSGGRPAPEAVGGAVTGRELDMRVDLAPGRIGALLLRNPLLVASGVAGYGMEMADDLDLGRLGGLCTRGTTLQPRSGSAPPRMAEVPAGLLNAVGLPNPGIDAVLERHASRWASWDTHIIVNVCADSADGFGALAARLDGEVGVAAVELNLSCGETSRGGVPFAYDPDAAADAVAAARARTDLPVIAKLSPAALDLREVAEAVAEAGADAISAVNTLPGLAVDRATGRPTLGATYGGLSGPALKPIALRVVYEIAQVVGIPILGVGGVSRLEDVLDLLAVGATAVQVGTAALDDPGLPMNLADELEAWCRAHGLDSVRPLVGTARPSRRDRPSSRGAEYRLRR